MKRFLYRNGVTILSTIRLIEGLAGGITDRKIPASVGVWRDGAIMIVFSCLDQEEEGQSIS